MSHNDPKGLANAQANAQLNTGAKPFLPGQVPPNPTQPMPGYPPHGNPNLKNIPPHLFPPPPGAFGTMPPQSQYSYHPMLYYSPPPPFFPGMNPGDMYTPQGLPPPPDPSLSTLTPDFSQNPSMLPPFAAYPPFPGALPPQQGTNPDSDDNGLNLSQPGLPQQPVMYPPFDPMGFPTHGQPGDPTQFNPMVPPFAQNPQLFAHYPPPMHPGAPMHPSHMDPAYPPMHTHSNKFASKSYIEHAAINPEDILDVPSDDDIQDFSAYPYNGDENDLNVGNVYSVETMYSLNPLNTANIDPGFNTFSHDVDQFGPIALLYPKTINQHKGVKDFIMFLGSNAVKDRGRIINQHAVNYYTEHVDHYKQVLNADVIVEQGVARSSGQIVTVKKGPDASSQQINHSTRQHNDGTSHRSKDVNQRPEDTNEHISSVLDDSDDDNVLYSTETGVRKPHFNQQRSENAQSSSGTRPIRGNNISRANMGHDADDIAADAHKNRRQPRGGDLNPPSLDDEQRSETTRQNKRHVDAELFSRAQMGTIQVQYDEEGNPIGTNQTRGAGKDNSRSAQIAQQMALAAAAANQPRRQLGVDNVNVGAISKDNEKWRVVTDKGKRSKDLDQKFRGNIAATDWLSQVSHHFQILLNKLTIQRFHEVSHDIAFQIMCYAAPQTQDKFKQSAETAAVLIFDHALKNPNFAYVYTYLSKVLSENLPPNAITPSDGVVGKKLNKEHQFGNKLLQTLTEGLSIITTQIQDAQSIQNPVNASAPLLTYVAELDNEDNIKKQQRYLAYVKFFGELYRCGLVGHSLLSDFLSKLRMTTFDEFSGAVNKTGPIDKTDNKDGKVDFTKTSYQALLAWHVFLLHCGSTLEQDYPHLGALVFRKIKFVTTVKQLSPQFRFKFLDLLDLRTKNWVSSDPTLARPHIDSTMTPATVMVYDKDFTDSASTDGTNPQGHHFHKKRIDEKKSQIAKAPTVSTHQVAINVLTATDSAGNAVARTGATTTGGSIFQRALARKAAAAAAATTAPPTTTPPPPPPTTTTTTTTTTVPTPASTQSIIPTVAPVPAPIQQPLVAPITTTTPSATTSIPLTAPQHAAGELDVQWKPNFSSRIDLINYNIVCEYANLNISRWDPIRNALASAIIDYLGARDLGEINYAFASLGNKAEYQELLTPFVSSYRHPVTTSQLLQVHLPIFFATTFIINAVQKRKNTTSHFTVLPEVIYQYRRLAANHPNDRVDFSGITSNTSEMFTVTWPHVVAAINAGLFANYDDLMEEIPLLIQYLPRILAHCVGSTPQSATQYVPHVPLSLVYVQGLAQLFAGYTPPFYTPLFDIKPYLTQYYGVLSLLKERKTVEVNTVISTPDEATCQALYNAYFGAELALCQASYATRTLIVQQLEQMSLFLNACRQYQQRFMFTSQYKYTEAKDKAPANPPRPQNRFNNNNNNNNNNRSDQTTIPPPIHICFLSLLTTLSISLFLSGPVQDTTRVGSTESKDNIRRYSPQAVRAELSKLSTALYLTGQQYWSSTALRGVFNTEVLQPEDPTTFVVSPKVADIVKAIRLFAKSGPITMTTFIRFSSRSLQVKSSEDVTQDQLQASNHQIVSQFVTFLDAVSATKF